MTAADIQAAYRLRSKVSGSHPLLVSFYSTSLRTSVIRARRPKQKLQFRSDIVYINEQLTSLNADLSCKARQLVRSDQAAATWIRDGQIFLNGLENERPARISSFAHLA